jgi:hypothetical protein
VAVSGPDAVGELAADGEAEADGALELLAAALFDAPALTEALGDGGGDALVDGAADGEPAPLAVADVEPAADGVAALEPLAGCEVLGDAVAEPDGVTEGGREAVGVPAAVNVGDEVAESLFGSLMGLGDGRRDNRSVSQAAVLAAHVLAQMCGRTTMSEIVRFAQGLNQSQKRLLGFPRCKKNRAICVAPSVSRER